MVKLEERHEGDDEWKGKSVYLGRRWVSVDLVQVERWGMMTLDVHIEQVYCMYICIVSFALWSLRVKKFPMENLTAKKHSM